MFERGKLNVRKMVMSLSGFPSKEKYSFLGSRIIGIAIVIGPNLQNIIASAIMSLGLKFRGSLEEKITDEVRINSLFCVQLPFVNCIYCFPLLSKNVLRNTDVFSGTNLHHLYHYIFSTL